MKKHVSYTDIKQFRNVIHDIKSVYTYKGKDENGAAIYDPSVVLPVITFTGTVKLHGTNSGVSFNNTDGIWYQSRENIITPEKDNAGFAFFAETHKASFMHIINEISVDHNIDLNIYTISVYGEWAGKGIQKNIGISQLDKAFYLFGIKISKLGDDSFPAYWLPCEKYVDVDNKIYNVHMFKTYTMDIDFSNPQLSQNKLIEYTDEVENECPVAKYFDISGIGEGIVWTAYIDNSRYMFKVKGEKHAGKSKVKVLNVVDDERIKTCMLVADTVTPTWRLEQMLQKTCDTMNGGVLDRYNLGDYIRNVIADVVKEDLDIIKDHNLELKDITKYISDISRRYFFSQEAV